MGLTMAISIIIMVFFAVISGNVFAKGGERYFGARLCASPEYNCITIKRGDTWKKLFPDPDSRDLVRRVNRTNMRLRVGMRVAVPKDLKNLTIWDIAPFPRYIKKSGRKLILVDQDRFAWAAFDEEGELQWWGPTSSGKNYCKDVKRACITMTGMFYVFNKKGLKCESNIFPVGAGGARMPYCMFYYRGFALHGSNMVPGYRDSHGCIRLFTEDARWLNNNFVELPSKENNFQGTQLIVRELTRK